MSIYFINDSDAVIAFFCNSLEYMKITSEEKTILEQLDAGEQISKPYLCTPKRLEQMQQAFASNVETYELCDVLQVPSIKLTLNISNACNMNCGYCYANGGCYESEAGIMSADTVRKAVDIFYEKFGVLDCVKFIGGEPMLNVKAIEAACEQIDTKIAAGELERRPVYSMVTNGTIITDRLIELIKEYKIRVAVSIDGPEQVHNEERKLKNNTGSYQLIKQNVANLRASTENKQPVAINAVYTEIHRKHGLSVVDTLKAIRTETSIKDIHIVPVDAPSGSIYKLSDDNCFIKGVEEEIATEKEGNYFWLLKCIFQGLRKKIKTGHVICNAGIKTFSVAINGDVYPCHLFTDHRSFRLGNVYDAEIFSSKEYLSFRKTFSEYNRFTEGKCKNCFANKLCVGCAGANLFRTGNLYESDEFICHTFRNAVILALKLLVGEENDERSYSEGYPQSIS